MRWLIKRKEHLDWVVGVNEVITIVAALWNHWGGAEGVKVNDKRGVLPQQEQIGQWNSGRVLQAQPPPRNQNLREPAAAKGGRRFEDSAIRGKTWEDTARWEDSPLLKQHSHLRTRTEGAQTALRTGATGKGENREGGAPCQEDQGRAEQPRGIIPHDHLPNHLQDRPTCLVLALAMQAVQAASAGQLLIIYSFSITYNHHTTSQHIYIAYLTLGLVLMPL